jgi:hypothetical protein
MILPPLHQMGRVRGIPPWKSGQTRSLRDVAQASALSALRSFALRQAEITQFREDFTTDFTDFTDENSTVQINSLSVPSVPSVV